MSSSKQIIEAVQGYRYSATNETELQEALANALSKAGIEFEREVRLNAHNRIDFMVGSIGIEVKVDGNARSLARQLLRYAEFDSVDQLIVLTTMMRHRIAIGDSPIRGKPVNTVLLRTGVF